MEAEFSLNLSLLFGTPTVPQDPPVASNIVPLRPSLSLENVCSPKKVLLFNGSSIYLKPRSKQPVNLDPNSDPDSYFNMDDLYERVRSQDELRRSRRVLREAKRKEAEEVTEISQQPKILWSDKYMPKNFLDICPAGNERQYRMIMHWLNKWGSLVFGNPKVEDISSVDDMGRPLKKILLVHGPLGIGKTAVVHLLARQMGYHVEELNAANSMDSLGGNDADTGRGASVAALLKLRIKNALTTNTIVANGKPTCLVIDEIDSASNTGEIVKVLGDVLRSESDGHAAKEKLESAFFSLSNKKKKSKKPFTLNRPIICIANDIYSNTGRFGSANPMEKLRQFSEIISFRKASNGDFAYGRKINANAQKTVKAYLSEISRNEKLDLDNKEISEVFEICEGDIRASINYLQFSSRKLDPDLMNRSFDTTTKSGNKDKSISWFALVDRLFLRDQNFSKEQNFESIMRLVSAGDEKTSSSGSLDKVIRGCFNQYLDVAHLQDDSAERPAMISDWLFYYDALTTGTRDSSFYPALVTLKFWSLFSDINPLKFKNTESLIPNARGIEFESLEQLKKNKAIVQRIYQLLPLEVKLCFGGTSASVELYGCQLIPYLSRMFSPEIGSSRVMTSLKAHEQALIEKLASLSRALGLQLETQKELDLNLTFLLFAPDWDSITTFCSDGSHEQKRKLTNIKRQWLFPLLQQELDTHVASLKTAKKRTKSPEIDDKGANAKRQKLTSLTDYFRSQYGNVAAKTEAPEKKNDSARIWIKYHEGFSNAVRKNIGWKDLWGR